MNGLADQEDLRLRFDVLTKTKPERRGAWAADHRAPALCATDPDTECRSPGPFRVAGLTGVG